MESTGQRQCMDLYIHLYDDTLKLREGGVREVRGGEERRGEWREGVVEGGGEESGSRRREWWREGERGWRE